MNICQRCGKKDAERFGSFLICPKSNQRIYCCFECTDLCSHCHTNPVKYKCFHLPKDKEDVCEHCYSTI